jgi:hypothetical protein
MNILFHNALIVCTDFAVRFKMEGEIKVKEVEKSKESNW